MHDFFYKYKLGPSLFSFGKPIAASHTPYPPSKRERERGREEKKEEEKKRKVTIGISD